MLLILLVEKILWEMFARHVLSVGSDYPFIDSSINKRKCLETILFDEKYVKTYLARAVDYGYLI